MHPDAEGEAAHRHVALVSLRDDATWTTPERFIAGDFPDSCNLPTGLGKTNVIAIWLLALRKSPATIPLGLRNDEH